MAEYIYGENQNEQESSATAGEQASQPAEPYAPPVTQVYVDSPYNNLSPVAPPPEKPKKPKKNNGGIIAMVVICLDSILFHIALQNTRIRSSNLTPLKP